VNQVDLIAFLILFLGIVILAYPLFLLVFERATERKSSDMLFIGAIGLLGVSLIIALWAVYYASTSPELLWPLAVFTLFFRFISPLIFVKAILKWQNSNTLLPNSAGRIFSESFPGVAMVIGTFILLSPYLTLGSSENLELLIATGLAIFTFTQFYLFLFAKYIRIGGLAFAWVAGFLIGVGLVLMVPYYLDGFDSAFRITSSMGWFSGGLIMMYGEKSPYSDYLRKISWYPSE
jgi:hypothetical protein